MNEQIKVVTNDKKCEVVVSDSDAKKDAISGVVATSGDDDDDNNKEQLLSNNDRRYLQCPAAVTMSHLQKFVRMKYALTSEHRVSQRKLVFFNKRMQLYMFFFLNLGLSL